MEKIDYKAIVDQAIGEKPKLTQRYFRGNLLCLKWGHEIWSAKSNHKERPKHVLSEDETAYFIDISPEYAGKEVVIQGSYGDLYGKAGSGGGYSVAFLDGSNEVAWINENQMEFISTGGEHLFQTINENKDKRRLDMCVSIVEVLATEELSEGIAFDVRANKTLEFDVNYFGFDSLDSNYFTPYRVISKKNGVYKIAPVIKTKTVCAKYLKKN